MQHFPTSTTTRRLAACLVAGLALATAACTDDDGDASAATSTPAEPGLGADGCDAVVELGAAFAGAPQDPAEMAGFGETLRPIVDRLAAALPPELADAGETLTAAVDAVATEGNPEQLFSPEGTAAQSAIGAAAYDGCEAERVDVVATEFAFDGVADELPAGRVSFELTNDGTEEHELIVLRRNDGSDASLDELLAQGPDALFAAAQLTGVAFAAPSEVGYAALDLEPGTYFLVCTIPTGGDPEAEPHAARGMRQTVEVV